MTTQRNIEHAVYLKLRGWEWQTVVDALPGTVFHEERFGEVKFIVMRGPCSICAYVGVPEGHPLAGRASELIEELPTHGGLTFGGKLADLDGYWWFGWDYAHMGDKPTFQHQHPGLRSGGKEWTPQLVIADSQEAVNMFCRMADAARG